jgi:3-hydroxyisobutyrate dehydrogenase-like beta-hydroxyacid dehydrogenase
MMATLPALGFAGIGLMGLPMCRRLLAAGYPLTVWNRNPAKCAALVEAGARQVATPAELCQHADLVMLCLADTAVVREVGGVRPGGRCRGGEKWTVAGGFFQPGTHRDAGNGELIGQ